MNQKITVIGLFLIFFVPLLIATIVYFNPDKVGFLSSRSHGTLLTLHQLPQLATEATATMPAKKNVFQDHWTLLYWNKDDCDLYCEASLFKMRQVRLSLGKYMKRTQTVYLVPQIESGASIWAIKERHPKLMLAHGEGENQALIEQLQQYPPGNIYLVDRFGNLVMQYSKESDSKGILRDLKKLLSISGNA